MYMCEGRVAHPTCTGPLFHQIVYFEAHTDAGVPVLIRLRKNICCMVTVTLLRTSILNDTPYTIENVQRIDDVTISMMS